MKVSLWSVIGFVLIFGAGCGDKNSSSGVSESLSQKASSLSQRAGCPFEDIKNQFKNPTTVNSFIQGDGKWLLAELEFVRSAESSHGIVAEQYFAYPKVENGVMTVDLVAGCKKKEGDILITGEMTMAAEIQSPLGIIDSIVQVGNGTVGPFPTGVQAKIVKLDQPSSLFASGADSNATGVIYAPEENIRVIHTALYGDKNGAKFGWNMRGVYKKQ